MNSLSIDYIRNIIIEEMELEEDRVYIYNQKFTIPKDDELFIVLEYNGAPKVISNRNYMDMTEEPPVEVNDLNMQERIVVGVFSKNESALQRKEEVLMAIHSIYSQNVQEQYSFRIFRSSVIEDLSFLEASALLYRFDIPLIVNAWYKKTKEKTYYEVFQTQVTVNDGQPDMKSEVFDPREDPTDYPK